MFASTISNLCRAHLSVMLGLTMLALSSVAHAVEVFSSDFSKGTFEQQGWSAQGDWSIVNFGDGRADLKNNPGPVAKFPANGRKAGSLTKTFAPLKDPSSLKLTFDAGYGWGAKDHAQGLQIMLLDAAGNGYVFDTHRANANWGAQWAVVDNYGYPENLHWNTAAIDTTQQAVVDGGGLRTFTINRAPGGVWTFSGEGWTGATPMTFTDNTTTTFSQVVLFGTPNNDDLLYGKVKLEADKLGTGPIPRPAQTTEYADFNPGRMTIGSEWTQVIKIISPTLRSEVQGNVKVEFQAPGMTKAVALCWQQPTAEHPGPMGHDEKVADLTLDAAGNGSFTFPAEKFPNGPITVRILAQNETKRDSREIQLYNKGGVKWNQGIPKSAPPAAQGMKLVFSDDFDGPLSISRDGKNARYVSHKPGGGDFSGWPFSDFEGPLNPFSQQGTYLRIHASKPEGTNGSSGLLAPVKADGNVNFVKPPMYMECRFTAQSAPGTWPAFWTISQNKSLGGIHEGTDELDIIEAYGGVGPSNPNHPGYSVTSHYWGQNGPDGKPLNAPWKRIDMLNLGNKSYWSTTFHTYGLKLTPDETIYYFDDIEVFRHPSGEISKTDPLFFMINYAIGGISGWKIDLEREGNATDMWVDYVRVYEGK